MIPTTWKSRSFKEDRRQVNRRFHYLTRVSGKCLAPITDLAAFGLLELITHGLDKPDAAPPPAVIAAMIAIQTIGIVAMAFVVLGRLEAAFSRRNAHTNRQPAAWRRLAANLSIRGKCLARMAQVTAGMAPKSPPQERIAADSVRSVPSPQEAESAWHRLLTDCQMRIQEDREDWGV